MLFLLGAIVRMMYLGSIPPGLNQDEASIGYEAYSILHYGIDRNGIHLPVHLISWGSGQNALYAYLSMPFLLLFGLTPFSVRALSLVMGLLGMIFFYLIMKRLLPSRTAGIAAMFFIAVNPWHIMMSRWALESNLFPTLILIAVYSVIKSFEASKWTYGFTVMLVLALYSYGTAYFFVPVFALCTAILLLYSRVLKLRTLLWNLALFVMLALPILLFIVINRLKLEGIETPFFSIPRLTVPRVEEISSVFGGQLLQTASANFSEFFAILISGSDGLPWNTLLPYGYAYPIGLPFAFIGLVVMIHAVQKRDGKGAKQVIILLWLLVALGVACIASVNINRINIIFFPLIMLMVVGFMWVYSKLKLLGILSALVFTVMFSLFTNAYFREFPDTIAPYFYDSLGEAIRYASEETAGEVYVTDEVNMPYIYVLFYEKINPHSFGQSVVYANPGEAFERVSSFGRYRFGNPVLLPAGAAYIFGNNQPLPAVQGKYTVKRFSNYSVLITSHAGTGAAELTLTR